MSAYQSAVLRRFGYTPTRGCGRARLCPAFSLPTLFEGGALGTSASSSGSALFQTLPLLQKIPLDLHPAKS